MRRLVLAAASVVALARPAQAETRIALSEAEVVTIALRTHPTIDAAAAARDAARAEEDAAIRARIPDVQLVGRYARLSSIPFRYRSFDGLAFPQFLDSLSGRANLTVPLTDAFLGLAAAARAAGKNAEAAELQVVATRAEVAYDARAAFLGFWRKKLALDTATELVRAAENNATDQRNRAAAGTVARNDVLPFETQLDEAAMGLALARGELAGAEASLRTFLPELRDRELVVPGLPAEPPEPPPVAPPPAQPPRLAVLDQQARAAEARADAASLNRLPKLGLFASGEIAAPNPRAFVLNRMVALPSWEAGAQVEWSFSQLTVGGARTTAARAEHAELVAKLVDAKRKLEAERTGTTAVLTAAHERVRRAQARVQHAQELARARRGELEAGTALPLNVVLAESDLARAKNAYVDAFVERALSRARLDFIDGRANP